MTDKRISPLQWLSTKFASINHTHSNYLTSHQDISGKEDVSNKSSSISTDTGSTSKYPTVKAVEDYAQPKGNYLTQHQSLTDYVQKSQTQGLLKNDGTVDTTNYLSSHQTLKTINNQTLTGSGNIDIVGLFDENNLLYKTNKNISASVISSEISKSFSVYHNPSSPFTFTISTLRKASCSDIGNMDGGDCAELTFTADIRAYDILIFGDLALCNINGLIVVAQVEYDNMGNITGKLFPLYDENYNAGSDEFAYLKVSIQKRFDGNAIYKFTYNDQSYETNWNSSDYKIYYSQDGLGGVIKRPNFPVKLSNYFNMDNVRPFPFCDIDLGSYTTKNFDRGVVYYYDAYAMGNFTLTDSPVQGKNFLLFNETDFNNGSYDCFQQKLVVFDIQSTEIYVRSYIQAGGLWGSWVKLATSSDIDTALNSLDFSDQYISQSLVETVASTFANQETTLNETIPSDAIVKFTLTSDFREDGYVEIGTSNGFQIGLKNYSLGVYMPNGDGYDLGDVNTEEGVELGFRLDSIEEASGFEGGDVNPVYDVSFTRWVNGVEHHETIEDSYIYENDYPQGLDKIYKVYQYREFNSDSTYITNLCLELPMVTSTISNGSSQLVTSDAVYDALQNVGGGGSSIVDSTWVANSTNPVQSQLIKTALDGKSDTSHTHNQYLTEHQSLTNYVQKNSTTGLIKNDGTIMSGGTGSTNYAIGNHTHSSYVNPTIADNLTTNDSSQVLSAKQGKILNDLIGQAISYINQ